MGYERKRGALMQLIKVCSGEENEYFQGDIRPLKDVRYILTVDADTHLAPGALLGLISRAAHPLNDPVYSAEKGRVISGYGIIQPGMGTTISSLKTYFARFFSPKGGLDAYSGLVSDVYQDIFGCASFGGKGIINVRAFNEAIGEKIPENTVLSHDLLEGSYLGCATAGDVKFFDSFPGEPLSYYKRAHRWTRGDWQLARWLFEGELSFLARFKIFANIFRTLFPGSVLLLLLLSVSVLPGNMLVYFAFAVQAVFYPLGLEVFSKAVGVYRAIKRKYVMALMNGARLGIAAQSVGLSQAAYNEGLAYAKERKQFGKAIIEFPAVYDMLSIMKAKLDAGRALLYQTSRYVDIYKALDDIARERKLTPEERQEQKKYAKLADSFTPLAKGMNSEYANQNAYDCIQIHGGSGFMLEYACQRIYRDARITSIYEGTTQLQTVAAIRYVTNGSYLATIREFETIPCSPEMEPLKGRLVEMANKFEACMNKVKEAQNQELQDFVARRLYEMAADCIMAHLLIQDATKTPEMFAKSAVVYLNYVEAEVEKHSSFILKFNADELASYRQ